MTDEYDLLYNDFKQKYINRNQILQPNQNPFMTHKDNNKGIKIIIKEGSQTEGQSRQLSTLYTQPEVTRYVLNMHVMLRTRKTLPNI